MKRWVLGLCMVAACSSEGPRGDDELGTLEGGARVGGDAGVDGGIDDGNGNGATGPTCSQFTVKAERAVPDMLIVLDRSGSMAPDGNPSGTDRWSGSVDAVVDVVGQFDDRISFGLMTFPTAGSGSSRAEQCKPGGIDVRVGVNRGPVIAQRLQTMDPDGFTPTAATLEAARAVIEATPAPSDSAVAPKYILLVTDGDPNCSANWGGGKEPDLVARSETIAAIEKLSAGGVRTFVVGYQTASTSFALQLDKMAVAGGTGATAHRSVESGADLASAFEEISSRAVSCSYQLEQPVDDPSFVLVTIGGKSRAYGKTSDGWTLGPDKQTVTLTGAACDALRDGATFSVEIVCEAVEVI